MSDNSIPLPSGQQPAPPAAIPFAPAPLAQPTQAYPGAAPSYAPAPPSYSAPVQPYVIPQAPYAAVPPQQSYYPAGPVQQAPGYPAYGTPIYPAARPASGLAIASLVCGIVGVVFFWTGVLMLASIVAVITGHLALRQTKQNPAVGGRGMAFAGLIMGYAVTSMLLITLLVAIIGFGVFTLPFIVS